MYKINLKTQVLDCGVKVTREEKGTIVDDFESYGDALTYLNKVFLNLSNLMMRYENGLTTDGYVIKLITRKSDGILIVRYLDRKCTDKKRIYTIVKKR